MLDIMDTYNHDDMDHKYGNIENYNNSIFMNRGLKKVKGTQLTIRETRFLLSLMIMIW